MRIKVWSINIIFLITLMVLLQSCVAYRYLRYGGPAVDKFDGFERDTINRGSEEFRFYEMADGGSYIDTLNVDFYLQRSDSLLSMTIREAMNRVDAPQACLIIRNDTILFEYYCGGWNRESQSNVFSLTKNVTALLCGIAQKEGYIRSFDDVVTDYIPELSDKNSYFKELKIQHLLDMTAGLSFKEDYSLNPFSQMARLYMGGNVLKEIKRLKFKNRPGECYEYNSMTTAILGLVIERATGIPYSEYLSTRIWQPLGMEKDASITLDSRRHRVANSYGGLTTNVRDLAKIGRLFLHKGNWNGRQIVDSAFVERCFSKHHAGTKKSGMYSNSWYWGVRDIRFFDTKDDMDAYYEAALPTEGEVVKSLYNKDKKHYLSIIHRGGFWGLGVYGQVLYVHPEKNVVAVFLGGNRLDYYERVFDSISF